jgi:hypothetical protein
MFHLEKIDYITGSTRAKCNMRTCQKINCELPSISRGKYCEKHRTNKKKPPIERIRTETEQKSEETHQKVEHEKQLKLDEDRIIRSEQDKEYEETVRADQERLDQIEYNKVLEMSINEYFLNKKASLGPENIDGVFYNIKIQLPNGLKITRKFKKDCSIGDIRDYIDVYFFENKINIPNYELIINFPYQKFTKDDCNIELQTLEVPKMLMLFLSNLDA